MLLTLLPHIRFYCSLLLVGLLCSAVDAFEKPFVELKCRPSGMFSVCNDVLSLLNCYEQGFYAGIKVNFAQGGLYYEPRRGSNWWTYYFEPIHTGSDQQAPLIKVDGEHLPHAISRPALRAFNKHKAHQLIRTYIHPKQHINAKVDQFVAQNFQDHFVIGIHYRGTDKVTEAPRVPYEQVAAQVTQAMDQLYQPTYKIFIATDELGFLQYMEAAFPHKICYYADAIRSVNQQPVHIKQPHNHYKLGEDALIDCLLLAHTQFLIRTSSNLSLWSTYFNPDLPVIDLSQRYEP